MTHNLSRVTWVLQWLIVDCLQHAMLIPVLVCHLRFHRSCDVLEKVIDYKFKNRFLLQLALTHPSYRWGSVRRHLSACLLSIDVVWVSDILHWMGANETSKSQRGWFQQSKYWTLNSEHVTCFAAVMFRHWHIVSLLILVPCILSCTFIFAPFCLFFSIYVSFFPSLLSLYLHCFFTPYFVCYAFDLFFSLLCLFYSPPFLVPPVILFFSFIYLIFFCHLIFVGFYSFFVSSLSFEVFLPLLSLCYSALFLFLYISLLFFSFPSYLTLSCTIHCSI